MIDEKKRIAELETENARLREIINRYETDNLIGFYLAINEKIGSMAQVIRNYTVALGGKDKGFERFWKMVKEHGDLVNSMVSLEKIIKERLGVAEVKEEHASTKLTFYEQLAEKKKQ